MMKVPMTSRPYVFESRWIMLRHTYIGMRYFGTSIGIGLGVLSAERIPENINNDIL